MIIKIGCIYEIIDLYGQMVFRGKLLGKYYPDKYKFTRGSLFVFEIVTLDYIGRSSHCGCEVEIRVKYIDDNSVCFEPYFRATRYGKSPEELVVGGSVPEIPTFEAKLR